MASGEKGHKKDGREAMAKDAALIESEKIDELPTPKPDHLCDKAEQLIRQRQADSFRQNEIEQSRKERLTVVLMSAMEMAEDEAREADLAALEKALNAAQTGGVVPQLRVRARRLLMEKRRKRERAIHAENMLKKTIEEISRAAHDGNNEKLADDLQEQIAIATRNGLKKSLIEQAQRTLKESDKERRKRQLTEQGLKELITSDDKDKIEDALFLYARDFLEQDDNARRIVAQLEVRRAQLEQRQVRRKELSAQIEEAKHDEDLPALLRLCDEAKREGIKVSPAAICTLHSLQANAAAKKPKAASRELDTEEPSAVSLPSVGALSKPEGPTPQAAQVTRKLFVEKKQDDVSQAVTKAEDDPRPTNVDFARKAIIDAKLERLVPEDEINKLEKRLAVLERTDGVRIQAESELSRCLNVFEKIFDHQASANDGNLIALQTAVDAAVATGASPELLKRGRDLLDKWKNCGKDQRKRRELLRDALQRTGDTQADIHQLAAAIKLCEENGVNASHAERKLAQWESAMERRIAAENELAEASDESSDPNGRQKRLEYAIRAAEAAGVSDFLITEAQDRLARLARHEKRCSAMAGNIKRLLPSLQEEPWRFLELMEATKRLKPWSAELEKQVKASMDQMEKNRDMEERQKDAEEELRVVLMMHSSDLDKLQDVRSDKAPKKGADQDTTRLKKAIEAAQNLRIKGEILDEAVACLKAVKKERNKLNVAEHRLRLAVNSKDLPEIERSTREIRALGRNVAQPEGSQSARRPKNEKPNSARLMEMASTVAKQLDDASARRQAAESELWRWIADEQPPCVHDADGKPVPAEHAKAWVSEVLDIVHEGKQSGVSATLIEHAKLKIHSRLRAEKERREACQALAKAINGKDVATQDLMRGIHKVRRRDDDAPH